MVEKYRVVVLITFFSFVEPIPLFQNNEISSYEEMPHLWMFAGQQRSMKLSFHFVRNSRLYWSFYMKSTFTDQNGEWLQFDMKKHKKCRLSFSQYKLNFTDNDKAKIWQNNFQVYVNTQYSNCIALLRLFQLYKYYKIYMLNVVILLI